MLRTIWTCTTALRMKTIGLIGGVSPESTAVYYRIMNEMVRKKLGGLHSAKFLLYSCDFGEMVALAQQEDWDTAGQILVNAARVLQTAGASCLLIGANTLHRFADRVQATITIPLIHICDATGTTIKASGLRTVGLLGTKYTMEDGFYQKYMTDRFGLQTLVPNAEDRQWVHDVIYRELCHGKLTAETKAGFQKIIASLHADGAQGVILGCTEIPLIVHHSDYDIPLFDTTSIHATAAVEFALRT